MHAGLAVLGVAAAQQRAIDAMPDLVGHWVDKAYNAARDRDQATFGQLIGQTAGAIGQGAEVQAQVQVRVSIRAGGSAPPLTTIDAVPAPAHSANEQEPAP